MKLSLNNFLYAVKQIVTGGGLHSDGSPYNDSGYLTRASGVNLNQIMQAANLTATAAALTEGSGAIGGTQDGDITTLVDPAGDNGASLIDGVRECAAAINKVVTDVAALRSSLQGTADETNAKVLKVEETQDTIGTIRWQVPRDYDEATDVLKVRVLASQLTQSTDDDVQLDSKVYVKTAGSALGSDLDPTKPTTVLSTTEQWITVDLSSNSLNRDDIVYFTLITDGHNDTDGEEVLIHDIEFVYRSCLVSYDETDSDGNDLR